MIGEESPFSGLQRVDGRENDNEPTHRVLGSGCI
jgi:hypothetical protein